MSRLNKAHDIIKLALMFQNSYCGICIDDIINEFETSRRSAERMKALLFDMFPEKIEEVYREDNKKKYWRFCKNTISNLITFSSDDFANLEYLKKIAKPDKKEQLTELINKIKAINSNKNSRSIDTDIEAIIEFEGIAVRQYSTFKTDKIVLEKLRNSMLAFKKITFDYLINDKLQKITLNPYGLIIQDKYYLVGFNDYVNDLRQYRVDKIQNLEILDEYFEKDENFSLKKYSEKSFGIYQEEPFNIALIFDKTVKDDVLNYSFHPTQKIKVLDNNDIQVKFTCGGKLAICFELFKWGNNVKDIKPKWLKEYYKGYLQSIEL